MEVPERHVVDVPTEAVLQRQVGGAHQIPRLPRCKLERATAARHRPHDPNAIEHRSHMVDSVQSQNGGVKKCPSTHPYPVPMLQTNFQFPIPTTRGKPTLSSGAYSTMHADFFNAWDQAKLEDLVDRCINEAPFTASNMKDADCGA
jgi:Domain of unknown function (DUF1996)